MTPGRTKQKQNLIYNLYNSVVIKDTLSTHCLKCKFNHKAECFSNTLSNIPIQFDDSKFRFIEQKESEKESTTTNYLNDVLTHTKSLLVLNKFYSSNKRKHWTKN